MVCPARAGMIRILALVGGRYDRLPRTRGDDPNTADDSADNKKFAPHARG